MAIKKAPPVNGKYSVGSGTIRLSADIGDAQLGFNLAAVDERVVATGASIQGKRIGKAADLKGTQLSVDTLARDVRTQTNRVSVTWKLDGGEDGEVQWDSKDIVAEDGDAVVFQLNVKLV